VWIGDTTDVIPQDARHLSLRPVQDLSAVSPKPPGPVHHEEILESRNWPCRHPAGMYYCQHMDARLVWLSRDRRDEEGETVLDRIAGRSLVGGWRRGAPVGIVSKRTVAGVPTAAVPAMSRPRRATRSWNRNPVACERTLKAVLARGRTY
jgi:hypothetical protein